MAGTQGQNPARAELELLQLFLPAQILAVEFGSSSSRFPASLWAVSWFHGCTVPSSARGRRWLGRQNQPAALRYQEEVGDPWAQPVGGLALNPTGITGLLVVAQLLGAGTGTNRSNITRLLRFPVLNPAGAGGGSHKGSGSPMTLPTCKHTGAAAATPQRDSPGRAAVIPKAVPGQSRGTGSHRRGGGRRPDAAKVSWQRVIPPGSGARVSLSLPKATSQSHRSGKLRSRRSGTAAFCDRLLKSITSYKAERARRELCQRDLKTRL